MDNNDKDSEKSQLDSDNTNKNHFENNNEKTEGVSTILGDPKKAIVKLSTPIMVSVVLASLNSLIDAIWIAGIGPEALAAMGFVTPLSMLLIGVSGGLSNGALSIISRFIGARDKKEADNAALHILLIMVIFTVAMMISVGLFFKEILLTLGAGSTVELALQYGYVIIGGSIFMMFSSVSYGIMRAEGNVKKTMYAMSLAAIMNMILDPIFIYNFNMGISGASLATMLSLAAASFLMFYWFKKDTYLSLNLKNFKYSSNLTKKILSISIPSSTEYLIMSLLVGSMNLILVTVSGSEAVAIFSAGWNIALVSVILLAPIAISVVIVVGASIGAKKYENLDIVQNYSIKLGTLIAIITAIITFIFAPYIAGLFTYSSGTANLSGLLTEFLRVMTLYYIFVPIGSVASSIFLGVGKGLNYFIANVIRQLLLAVLFAYVLAITLGWGQEGVWWGIVIGNIAGSLISILWSKFYIKKLNTDKSIV
ncbi:MAG: MATE family efflux transporter [Methanobrevibacter sp.]|nr:MATE family efflux transporter [Methanobrevibacter sp.]